MSELCKLCGKPFLPAHGLGGSCSMFLTGGSVDEYRAEIASLKQRLESAVTQLTRARRIIADIDDYMARPGRGDWGEECACCMGELLDDDRPTMIVIDAFLQEHEKQNG